MARARITPSSGMAVPAPDSSPRPWRRISSSVCCTARFTTARPNLLIAFLPGTVRSNASTDGIDRRTRRPPSGRDLTGGVVWPCGGGVATPYSSVCEDRRCVRAAMWLPNIAAAAGRSPRDVLQAERLGDDESLHGRIGHAIDHLRVIGVEPKVCRRSSQAESRLSHLVGEVVPLHGAVDG